MLPVTDRASGDADRVAAELDAQGFRAELDHRNEKIGKKIREADNGKDPLYAGGGRPGYGIRIPCPSVIVPGMDFGAMMCALSPSSARKWIPRPFDKQSLYVGWSANALQPQTIWRGEHMEEIWAFLQGDEETRQARRAFSRGWAGPWQH
ncbi:MAG: His/Gly/Thr/Pro-type tRNA ligase C-terminal domain-containing protein [Victivallales bacterium]